MPSGVKDIRLTELKDTISQLNTTISTQNELICSLQAMLTEREEKDAKKDQLIENLQAQLEYLKTKVFGSASEIRRDLFPGQMSLFDSTEIDEKPAETILPEELIPVKAHTKKRKPKAGYDEMFAGIPNKNSGGGYSHRGAENLWYLRD